MLLKEMLSDLDLNILHAENGMEAVQLALNNNIDLVLMDIHLPVIDGYEATKRMKKEKPELFIIAQTAYAESGESQKALNNGCDNYISKPCSKSDLLALVSKYLGN